MKFDNKYVIGLTGGIGCGKTMILDYLKTEYDSYVIEADKIGHQILDYNTEGYDKVIKAFGDNIVNYENAIPYIDRKILGNIVFNDKNKLELLNSITHPLIHKTIEMHISNCPKQLIIIEAALMLDTSLRTLCDTLWYVYADEGIRLNRLQEYRNIDKEKALQIMTNQPTDEDFRNSCQVIIDNSFDKENTYEQIKNNLPGGRLWQK